MFIAVLGAAAALRAAVMLGYPPVMWFNDSYSYVYDAVHRVASSERPSGYPFLLAVLMPLHSFTVVAAVQHLMGLGLGVAIYALLRHRGLPGWGGTLVAVPVLFDAYQVQVEQQVMSDTLFMAALLAAVVVACWRDQVSVRAAAVAGLLTGLATLVRSAGLPLLLVMLACLVIRRIGWRPLAALLAAGALPVGTYLVAFHAQHGSFGITNSGGVFLYGRVMSFADCAVIKPPRSLAVLCDSRPPRQRPIAVEYIWSPSDPLHRLGPGSVFTPRVDGPAGQFARRAIVAQPLAYLRAVAADTLRSFGWQRDPGYDRVTTVLYQFSDPPPRIPPWGHWAALRTYQPRLTQPQAVQPYAGLLRAYQRQVYLRGTLLGLILLAGLAGIVTRWRDRGGAGLLPWAVAVVLLVGPAATSGFSYRYLLSVTPFACLAAGLACVPRRPARPAPLAGPGPLARRAGQLRREAAGGRAVEQEQGPLPATGARGRHLDRAHTGQGEPDRARFLRARGQDPHLPRALDGRQGQRQPGRGRLGRAPDGHHRPLVVERGQAGEQRRDVGVRADAEQQDVEGGDRAMIFRAGRRRQRVSVPRGGRLGIVAVGPVGAGHGVHPGRIGVEVAQQRLPGTGLVPLRVAGGQEALVPPPDVQPPPVHRVAGGRDRELGEHGGTDPAPGQHQRRRSRGCLDIDQPGDQPRGYRLGEQVRIQVGQHLRCGHAGPSRIRESAYTSSGSSRRSSSARSSGVSRRCRAARRSGWPGRRRCATRPS